MKKTTSLLLAALLSASGFAFAQSTTSDAPTQAGEMSTMTNGVPNQKTTNSPYPDGVAVVPMESSTAVMGGPPADLPGSGSVDLSDAAATSPTSVQEGSMWGSSHPIGTGAPYGNPGIFQGGTPK